MQSMVRGHLPAVGSATLARPLPDPARRPLRSRGRDDPTVSGTATTASCASSVKAAWARSTKRWMNRCSGTWR